MTKRELSSTLKNLKFMQRAAQKDEQAKKDEVRPAGDFPSCSAARRCVVIMEGDPHPGATHGRMSFLSFNPSVDKLNQEEESDPGKNKSAATSSGRQNEMMPSRENASSQHKSHNLDMGSSSNAANGDLKRKEAEVAVESQFPNKTSKNDQDIHGSSPKSFHHALHQQKNEQRGCGVPKRKRRRHHKHD